MMRNIIILCLAGLSNGLSEESCFVNGECKSSTNVGGQIVQNEKDCLRLCKNTTDCKWFTFFTDINFCELFQDCVILSEESCEGCVSGQQECDIPKPLCFVEGMCYGVVLGTSTLIETSTECLSLCQKTEKCEWFTHFPLATTCILLASCDDFDESCGENDGCTSGESACEVESPWHLTIGGSGVDGSSLNSAELYNWKTGVQCLIEPLPQAMAYHSGTLIDGDPVVCGGFNGTEYDVKCFHFERSTKDWKMISDLLAGTFYASDVYIEGQGWFLFGGNDLETSQKLVGTDYNWEQGPPVNVSNIWGQCAVKISENVTAFIGGDIGNDKNIYLYDWSSEEPSFVLQDEKLFKDREYNSCALIKAEDGSPVVAIIGGFETGMEVWNPQTRQVELLWEEIPPEVGESYGLRYAEILPVNDGSELILYGGDTGSTTDEIWKYNVETNRWTRIGNLLSKRYGHVTLPVNGIEC